MAPSAQAHNRSHSLLLMQKLLNLEDGASPLTLILDTLEQTAAPLVREYVERARISQTKVIMSSFATLKKPHGVDHLLRATPNSLPSLARQIADLSAPKTKTLLIIDTLNPAAASAPHDLPAFLSALVTPTASVLAVYHSDVPLVFPRSSSFSSDYEPHPLTLLCHLATTILGVSSLHHTLARRRAQNRSARDPEFGLAEGTEGVLIGLRGGEDGGRRGTGQQHRQEQDARAHAGHGGGVVVEMEMRRRSGRAVAEKFVLVPAPASRLSLSSLGGISLLSDHPLFAAASFDDDVGDGSGGLGGADEMGTTFSLGLTDKQRRDRDGIVLPYFDAQIEIGAGVGGRIMYDMGTEDDFDDEDDEI